MDILRKWLHENIDALYEKCETYELNIGNLLSRMKEVSRLLEADFACRQRHE